MDCRREDGVEACICPGIWYLELQLLTSGGSVAWLKSSRSRSNVNKVVPDFVRHGDLVSSPLGFKLLELKSGDEGRGTW